MSALLATVCRQSTAAAARRTPRRLGPGGGERVVHGVPGAGSLVRRPRGRRRRSPVCRSPPRAACASAVALTLTFNEYPRRSPLSSVAGRANEATQRQGSVSSAQRSAAPSGCHPPYAQLPIQLDHFADVEVQLSDEHDVTQEVLAPWATRRGASASSCCAQLQQGAHCLDSWLALISLMSNLRARSASQRRVAALYTAHRGGALVPVKYLLHLLEAVKARPLLRRERRAKARAFHASEDAAAAQAAASAKHAARAGLSAHEAWLGERAGSGGCNRVGAGGPRPQGAEGTACVPLRVCAASGLRLSVSGRRRPVQLARARTLQACCLGCASACELLACWRSPPPSDGAAPCGLRFRCYAGRNVAVAFARNASQLVRQAVRKAQGCCA